MDDFALEEYTDTQSQATLVKPGEIKTSDDPWVKEQIHKLLGDDK